VPLEFLASPSGSVANSRGLGAELRVFEQFLDVAHPVGPLTETIAGDRPTRSATAAASAVGIHPFEHPFQPLAVPALAIRLAHPALRTPLAIAARLLALLTLTLLALTLLTLTLLALTLLALTLLTLTLLTLLTLLALALLSLLTLAGLSLLALLTLTLLPLTWLALIWLAWLSLAGLLTLLSLTLLTLLTRFALLTSWSVLRLSGLALARLLTFLSRLRVRIGLALASGAFAVGVRGLVQGDFAVELICEVFEFGLGSLERGGLVAEDAPGGLVDPFADLTDPLASLS
jgi:hypothetical protein